MTMRTRTKVGLGVVCVLALLLVAALAMLRSGTGSGSAVPVPAGEQAAGRPAPGAEPVSAPPPPGDMADARAPATAPALPAAPAAGTTEVERYPAMEAPDRVRSGQEFAVDVSLTEEQVDPTTKITGGRATADRRLVMQLPAGVESWKIDVVFSAAGFAFTRGTNTGSVILPRSGDSTSAVFHLRAPDIDTATRPCSLRATLWHDGAYLGRIQRGVVVFPAANATARPAPATASPDGTSPVVPSAAPAAGAIDIGQSFETPDLTVYVLDRALDASRSTEVIISSPHLQPARYDVPRVPGRREWIAAQLAQLARRGRGFGTSVATAAPAASDFARGFGRQLYRDCVPAPFKEAFWRVADALGNRFRSIQIVTDDPSFPWELVRPSPPGGGADREFLGLEFRIARWHVGADAPQMQRPPQEIRLERLLVVAPQYAGASALPAQAAEVAALKALPGFEPVAGRVAGLRELFQRPRAGMIHFSGHGSVRDDAATSTFAIRLEDGELDVTSWRGMASSGQASPHPLVFFNACDVGNARATAGLVEGWAPALLGAGASGYIGALWAVDDRGAAEFATQFYQRVNRDLQAGPSRPGQVLADTRRSLFEGTGDPTALAYVFYGDPLLRLVRAAHARQP